MNVGDKVIITDPNNKWYNYVVKIIYKDGNKYCIEVNNKKALIDEKFLEVWK